MADFSFKLPDEFLKHVERRVAEGSFSNASEYFSDLMGRDREREQTREERR